MVISLIFSLLIGLSVAYILQLITLRLLVQYEIYSSSTWFYYVITPFIFFILGFSSPSVEAYFLGGSFLSLLITTAIMDYYTFEVRHRFVVLIGIIGILHLFLIGTPSLVEMTIGFFAASLPFLIISLLTHGSIGGGDIKLLASCGLVMGYSQVLLGTFLGIILGGFYGIFLLLLAKKERRDALPLVPFLAIGLSISYLWGTSILHWYLGLFHLPY